jgi:hypothetical protein
MSMKTKDIRFHDTQFRKGTLGLRQRSLRSCRLCFFQGPLSHKVRYASRSIKNCRNEPGMSMKTKDTVPSPNKNGLFVRN